MSSEAPSAEAKKADGARLEQLRNPRPPWLTGRVAWHQDKSSSSKQMLVILETIDLNKLSQVSKKGDEKAGDVRRMCRSLGWRKNGGEW